VYSHMTSAVYIVYGLIAVNLVFAVVLYGIKFRNVKQQKAHERFHKKFKDYLIYIQANIDSEERLRVPPGRMNRLEFNLLQERLNDMIESFAGEQREKLIDLCGQIGFPTYHLQRLRGRSYRRKIDAAYHLGCMRVKEAVPAMLELLRRHKADSSLFVIARAIAKCAQDPKDIKDMVHILLSKGRSIPDLIADMIEESSIDQTALFAQFIQSGQPELIRIGLVGLKAYTAPEMAAAVYRLMDSSNKEIERKSIEIYLNSTVFLPANVVNRLLGHADAEIRLLTVQALSEHRNSAYAGALRNGLKDPDPRVVHASANGLLRMGEKGMLLFCEAAKDSRDSGEGTVLQDMIEEELHSLSARTQNVNYLTQYNALLYAYERTFGKNKRIYRVV